MTRNYDKAKEWLEEYLSRLEEYEHQPYGDWGRVGQRAADLVVWFQSNQDRVMEVVTDLVPDQAWCLTGGKMAWDAEQRAHIRRALGKIAHTQSLAEHWSQESAIEINPSDLHPWVWRAARGLWESGHWGEAVEAATKVVNTKLQDKVGSRVHTGTDLVRRALSLNAPEQGQSRLRVMQDDGSDTYRSAQEGAMHLGEAVFMYWRNVLAHEPGGADRQLAIEGLAAVSTLARLIDCATLCE